MSTPSGTRFSKSVPSGSESTHGRVGGAAQPVFRDPEPLEPKSRSLQLQIVGLLANVPDLPISLPAFGVTLLGVEALVGSLRLVFGLEDPFAGVDLRRKVDSRGEWAGVEAQVTEFHPLPRERRASLDRIAARLSASIRSDNWREAWTVAKQLLALPSDVPLTFFRHLVPGVPGQGLVRTGFNCNQDCGICWQGRHWGRFGSEQTLTWIEDLFRAGARSLIVSGGGTHAGRPLTDLYP